MPATALNTALAARWFQALSDETRLEIVVQLLDGERCVCELIDDLDVAQSRLSFHLKTLKDAGLVTDRREGRWVYYTLNRQTLEQVESLVGWLRHPRRTLPRLSACCD